MKILFVFTGGTIGSTLGSSTSPDGKEYIGIDRDKPYKLIESYRAGYAIDFKYDTAQPVTMLSENSTGECISAIVREVRSNLDKDYDGIIVTHGTDTIQYTAAALGYCLGRDSIPVCIVSSDYPIEDPRANGLINLHGAVTFIRKQAGRGVYVIYRNAGAASTSIHRATGLLAHQTLSASLYSLGGNTYGEISDDGDITTIPGYTEYPDETAPLSAEGLGAHCTTVMCITPYPGMVYPEIPDTIRHIVHGSYHSGTINTDDPDCRRFFEQMYERGIDVYLTGITPDADYASTRAYKELHIQPVPGIAPIALYMKLWLTDSCGIPAMPLT